MPGFKAKELRNLTSDELKEKLESAQKELFSLRSQAKLGRLEKHSTVRMNKRNVARIMTLLKEKEPS